MAGFPPPYPYNGNTPKIIVLAEAQNWRCAYCPTVMGHPTQGRSNPDSATVDHVLAKMGGGKASWDNEVAACAACNHSKGQYSAMLFWLLMQAFDCNRRTVHKALRSRTQKTRDKLKRRLAKDHAAGRPLRAMVVPVPAQAGTI